MIDSLTNFADITLDYLMRDKEQGLNTLLNFSEARRLEVSSVQKIQVRNKTQILMVGMHLTKTRGGITTLVAEILKSSLTDNFEFFYVESQAEDFGSFAKLKLAAEAVVSFVKRCMRHAPEVVYIHLGSNASLYRESVFIVLAKFFRRRVVAHFHAGDLDNYYPYQSFIGRAFIRGAINSSDALIAVSGESARQLRKLAAAPNITVIPNAIDTTIFGVGKKEATAEQKTGKTVRLLFVGAIGKLKGERDLIRALSILRGRGCQYDLQVSFLGYGAESLEPVCREAGVTDWIDFLGAVSLEKRVEFFRRADIFVLPTYAEAMPMSIIEAMAAGLPVISTNVGGIPEMIEHEVDGLLVVPGDVAELADKIQYLLENGNVRRAYGAQAAHKARRQFDIRQYVVKLREQLLTPTTEENE